MLRRKKKETRGAALIEEVAGQFSAMVDRLYKGAADCDAERQTVRHQIEGLKQRDSDLGVAIQRAETLATNLNLLIGA